MERILINIGQVIQTTAATEDGRKIISELALNLMSYAAAAAIGATKVETKEETQEAAPTAPASVSPPPTPVAIAPAALAPASPAGTELAAALTEAAGSRSASASTASPSAAAPIGYTLISAIANDIGTEMKAFETQAKTPQERAAHISKIMAKVAANPGLLISPTFFATVNTTIDRLINDLAAYKDQPWAKSYAEEYAARKRRFICYTPYCVRYTWTDADGVRTTVVGTKRGGFLEIRRGDLTGKALQKNQPRTWANSTEMLNYWSTAGIPFSKVATAPY